ncbi:MAG: hypothetical protein E6Q76_19620 [Rhizobium sp.]|nr:MAG: hypothetical protein E6Q76_19620 [Rhizobium sp.]
MARTRLTAERLEAREVPALFGAAGGVPLGGGFAPDLAQTFTLQSLPGAEWTVWLDFEGGRLDLSRSPWQMFDTIDVPAFDQDGNPKAFSSAELASIQQITRAVAEDYAPFNVNVTTRRPADLTRTQRVVIGGAGERVDPQRRYSGLTAGRIWDAAHGREAINFVWPSRVGNRADHVAEVVSHEVGHAFGLDHDGTASAEYFRGANGWAPIMGAAFGALSQWDNGAYLGATNTQPDADVIAATAGWRPDDFGDSYATAALLLSGQQRTGLIGRQTDVDVFRLTSGAGPVSVSFAGATGGNLYARVSLYDASGKLLAQGNGTTAALTAAVPGGTYYVTIDGTAGPAPNDYGSLGQYWFTATAAPEEIPLPPPPTGASGATLSAGDVAKPEGSSLQPFSFALRLSRWLTHPVTVAYWTEDGTAVAGADYRPVAGTLVIKPYLSSATVTVLALGDREPEPDTWFRLRFAVLDGDVTALGGAAVGTILNDDGPGWQFGSLYLAPEDKPLWR